MVIQEMNKQEVKLMPGPSANSKDTTKLVNKTVKLAWRSGSVMDYHATAQGSIPGGNSIFTELHVLRKGQ